jgi:hypothetical protein
MAVRAAVIPATVASAVMAASTLIVSSSAIVVASLETASVAPSTAPVEAPSPVAVVPRPGSNENSTYEPVRSVVAVRSAGVRIVIVVAVTADGKTTYVSITCAKSNANRNLAMGIGRGNCQDSYECEIC